MLTVEKATSYIVNLFEKVNREGSDNLLSYLADKSDFFTAPASTRYHSAFAGGLAVHTALVHKTYTANLNLFKIDLPEESAILISICHDLCKLNFYAIEYRNKKINGSWEQVPEYVVQDQWPFGHAEKSIDVASRFIKLTDIEKIIIRWHMGPSYTAPLDTYAMSTAFTVPEVLLFHCSDLQASMLFEERNDRFEINDTLYSL